MKSLSVKTFQCGVTIQGLTTLSGTVYLTALTNTATWDYIVVGTTAQGQLYTRTYAQIMSDITSGIPSNANGTTNYISKFTGSTTLGNSQIFDNGTNVGIGTTSPSVPLHVVGNILVTGASPTFSGGALEIQGTANAVKTFYINRYGVATGSQHRLRAENAYFEIASANSEPIVLTGGNVGIGTFNPLGKLHIADDGPNALRIGDTQVSTIGETNDGGYPGMKIVPYNSNIHIGISSTNDNKINLWYAGNNYTYWQQTTTYSVISNYSTNALVFQVNGGNVGIGITAPTNRLQVAGGRTYLETGNEIYTLGISRAGANAYYLGVSNSSSPDLYFSNNAGTTRLTLTDAGNLGLGVTPSAWNGIYKVVEIGTAAIYGTSSYNSAAFSTNVFYNASNSPRYIANDFSNMYWQDDGNHMWYNAPSGTAGNAITFTQAMTLNASGNLSVGNTNNTYKLDVSGTGNFTGALTGTSATFSSTLTANSNIDLTGDLRYQSNTGFGLKSANGTRLFEVYNTGVSFVTVLTGTSATFSSSVTATSLIKSGGTSAQYLMADGSVSTLTNPVTGTGTTNYIVKFTGANSIGNSLIYDDGTTITFQTGASERMRITSAGNVGIGTVSPGYNFDVNGQVRVQDKLRVGTVNSGNGVVHMSSTATINPSATTIVWAQNVSVGICAFIEYYILNSNSLTDQRAGTIIVTWNQSGTPTITHTETTTPDIGSTTTVNFTTSLVGADARINAVNSSANPYTMVMSYKYF